MLVSVGGAASLRAVRVSRLSGLDVGLGILSTFNAAVAKRDSIFKKRRLYLFYVCTFIELFEEALDCSLFIVRK